MRCPSGGASCTTGTHGGLVILCACFMLGCSHPSRSFNALLAKIDASPELATVEVFLSAAELAQGTEEKLRLLKRASLRDPSFFSQIAEIVIAQGAVTETIALAALDAYVLSGRFSDALALFEGPIDPKVKSAELTEVIVLSLRAKQPVSPSTEELVICADTSADSRFLVFAAIESLKNGDKSRAGVLLADTFESLEKFNATPAGFSVPIALLWDAGLPGQLSKMLPDFDEPLQMAICADAAYLLGMRAEATSLYAGIIERFPAWSWKPYAMLARGAIQEPAQPQLEWPYAPDANSYESLSQPTAVSKKIYARMIELFGDETDAMLEYSRYLYTMGQFAEARNLAQLVGGQKGAIALLHYLEPERVVPGALRLVAEYGESDITLDAVFRALCQAGAWDDFQNFYAMVTVPLADTRLGWFWSTISHVLSGDLSTALSVIRGYGPPRTGYQGVYDLGVLEWADGRLQQASEDFMMAAKLSSSASERSRALVMAGDVALYSGDKAMAHSMYTTAIAVNNDSRDARAKLERLSLDD